MGAIHGQYMKMAGHEAIAFESTFAHLSVALA